MTARTKATSITTKTRLEVMKRDGHKCVSCKSNNALTIAHVWINRSHGGKGIPENLCVLCVKCHHEYDNGKKHEQDFQRALIQGYMLAIYGTPDLNKMKYQKYGDSPF